jgi:hypothetical protein
MLIAAVNPAGARSQPKLTGTFLQLWADHRDWPPERWETMFRHFAALQLREIYVQWTVYDGIDYSKTVETIIGEAGKHRMSVYLGLTFDSGFWKMSDSPGSKKLALSERREQSIALARKLAIQHGRNRAFAGWYLSEEIHEAAWQGDENRRILFAHLQETARALHDVRPRKRVSISGFADDRTQPADLAKFWTSLLAAAPVDEVLFQDGVGVGNLGVAYVGAYLGSIKDAVSRQHRRFKIIVEIFRQVEGEFNGKPFRAIPAEASSLQQQLAATGRFSHELVAFAVPEYLTPEAGAPAAAAYAAYVTWLHSGSTRH